ncbi:MAG: cupredoxin domain-containing protein [Omnitrophica bacterium]|nr:cupredoxin domain-containing protein [Candidatus Omnitrophota bacterium]
MKIRCLRFIIFLLITGYWLFLPASFAEEEKIFEIKAKKFSYNPSVINVRKGDRVKIRLISEDVTHGLYIDGYELNTRAFPGQDGSISFVADKRGRHAFRCSVTCGEFHPYMIGYLNVGPNARFYVFMFLTLFLAAGSFGLIIFRKED